MPATRDYVMRRRRDTTVIAACHEVGCTSWRYGWETIVDERTPLGQQQGAYIRHQSGRTFTDRRCPVPTARSGEHISPLLRWFTRIHAATLSSEKPVENREAFNTVRRPPEGVGAQDERAKIERAHAGTGRERWRFPSRV